MQAKVRATRSYPLRRLSVHRRDDARFPIVLFAVDIGGHHFKWQSTFHKNNFAVWPSGNALGFHVERINVQPSCG